MPICSQWLKLAADSATDSLSHLNRNVQLKIAHSFRARCVRMIYSVQPFLAFHWSFPCLFHSTKQQDIRGERGKQDGEAKRKS